MACVAFYFFEVYPCCINVLNPFMCFSLVGPYYISLILILKRNRERERKSLSVCVCVHIYVSRESETERDELVPSLTVPLYGCVPDKMGRCKNRNHHDVTEAAQRSFKTATLITEQKHSNFFNPLITLGFNFLVQIMAMLNYKQLYSLNHMKLFCTFYLSLNCLKHLINNI